jgi:hypothetical protein
MFCAVRGLIVGKERIIDTNIVQLEGIRLVVYLGIHVYLPDTNNINCPSHHTWHVERSLFKHDFWMVTVIPPPLWFC